MTLSQDARRQYTEQGYVGAFRVLSVPECRRFLQAVGDGKPSRPPLDWYKGHAVSSRAFYGIGTHPAIVDRVAALLGDDVMLWGATLLRRAPNAVHSWHCDIECADPSSRTLTVWLGLEHTTRESSLMVVPYSHGFGVTVQELRHRLGKGRDESSSDDIIAWAQERDRRSHIAQPEVTDGEALFFDGQLWHGSHNVSQRTRRALLLQYAVPDTPIRIPDMNYLEWPFHLLNQPRPACLMLRGRARPDVNRFVMAPVASGNGSAPQLTSRVYPLRVPLPPDETSGWKPYPIFSGSTADLRGLACHVSTLVHGHSPHPPHTHKEEEILMVLDGEVELTLPALGPREEDQRRRLTAGEFVYYPPYFPHTLRTVSRRPANYLMFKWHTDATDVSAPLPFGQYRAFETGATSSVAEGFRSTVLVDGATSGLRKLQCHTSTLSPGAGYEPHVDAYDVAIVVLDGEVETLNERVEPHGVIFYAAGEPHGMRNPGRVPARYVVFEFHGAQKALADDLYGDAVSWMTKIKDPTRWKNKVRHLLGRLKGWS
jgi:quercetin dioxygenase-like cupin family protein